MQIIELYECILKTMCRKMFFNALKLVMVVRKKYYYTFDDGEF